MTAGDSVVHHVMTGDLRMPFARRDVAGQHFHRGAFAGPVRSEKSHQFALLDREGNIAGGREGAIKLAQADRFDHRRCGRVDRRRAFFGMLNCARIGWGCRFCHRVVYPVGSERDG